MPLIFDRQLPLVAVANSHCGGHQAPSGATLPYPASMQTSRRLRDVLTCGAVLWKNGNRCKNEAAPGSVYCPAHLCLLAPLEWVTGGYARVLDPGARPIFQSAAYATLSEEVALARLQLTALLRQDAPPDDVIRGISTVVSLVKLQNQIERAAVTRHRRGLKQEGTRKERLRKLERDLETAEKRLGPEPEIYGDPDPAYLNAAYDLTPRR